MVSIIKGPGGLRADNPIIYSCNLYQNWNYLSKGKGDALYRGNYQGLKLTEQAMKILERIVDGLIRQVVSIDDSQFVFVPGRGSTDAIFVVRQLQEKYLAENKRLYMAFMDIEKAFDHVPR